MDCLGNASNEAEYFFTKYVNYTSQKYLYDGVSR